MTALRVTNTGQGVVLGSRVRLAARWWPRLRGFLGHPAPAPGEGLLLTPCQAVHMFGMRFSLDVVFLDGEGVVVALYENLAPGKRTRMETKAQHALELPAGTISATGTTRGDRIAWVPAEVKTKVYGNGGNGSGRTAGTDPVRRDHGSGNGSMHTYEHGDAKQDTNGPDAGENR